MSLLKYVAVFASGALVSYGISELWRSAGKTVHGVEVTNCTPTVLDTSALTRRAQELVDGVDDPDPWEVAVILAGEIAPDCQPMSPRDPTEASIFLLALCAVSPLVQVSDKQRKALQERRDEFLATHKAIEVAQICEDNDLG